MQLLLKAATYIDATNRYIGTIVYWLTLLMVLIGVYNAGARYIGRWIGRSLTTNTFLELQWYLYSLVFLFMAGYALKNEAHVRVDVLHSRLSERKQAWIDLLGTLLFLIPLCFFTIYLSWSFVANSIAIREMSPDPGGLPRWPIKLAIPVAFFFLLLQGISQLVKNAAFLTGATDTRREPEASQREAT